MSRDTRGVVLAMLGLALFALVGGAYFFQGNPLLGLGFTAIGFQAVLTAFYLRKVNREGEPIGFWPKFGLFGLGGTGFLLCALSIFFHAA